MLLLAVLLAPLHVADLLCPRHHVHVHDHESYVNVTLWTACGRKTVGRKTVLETGLFGPPKGQFYPRGPTSGGPRDAHTRGCAPPTPEPLQK